MTFYQVSCPRQYKPSLQSSGRSETFITSAANLLLRVDRPMSFRQAAALRNIRAFRHAISISRLQRQGNTSSHAAPRRRAPEPILMTRLSSNDIDSQQYTGAADMMPRRAPLADAGSSRLRRGFGLRREKVIL